ncbi:MAG: NAD(P)/FAD-dependent oxidoreductase [Anaerolineales bacterium]|nr:NAD(P)/FAD-dependent oxidoreductase [Anaerolineales bacterium]
MAIRDTEFDVIVVGAGPVGSSVAEKLARASVSVALLEEHPAVGMPNHCSGLVSPRTLACAHVSEDALALAHYRRARVWAPDGRMLRLESDTVQAVAIDRTRFDQTLATRAVECGAELMLGIKAVHFERDADCVRVQVRQDRRIRELRTRLLVGADGACSRVAQWMGAPRPQEVIPAIKAALTFRASPLDEIEIFLGKDVAPGWFGWLIPLPDGATRVGLGTKQGPRRYFTRFLEMVRARFGPFDLLEGSVCQAPLPLGPGRDFVADRALLVGAAAGQTKPTTGGGVYFGLRAAELATKVAITALAAGDCSREWLAPYERAWAYGEGRELAFGRWLRRIWLRLPDSGLDAVVWLLTQAPSRKYLTRLGDMDYPSRLIRLLLPKIVRQTSKREQPLDHAPMLRARG